VPVREQVSKENVRVGDRLVAYVLDVLEVSRGAQIVLSRTHPNMVVKLFEQEVPEIAEGIVSVEGVAREAGFRTKIAVRSKDSDVDPVGACVGMKGARVQAVVQELRGEKIDIVPFDQDEARFVCNALAPAEVTRVLVNESEHSMQIVVPDDQLSLAIGRRGQNVRLAAELTGWKIDISSETKVAEEREQAGASLSRIEGMSEFQIQTLYNHGFRRAEDVANADVALLESLPGIEKDQVQRFKDSARSVMAIEKVETSKVHDSAKIKAKAMIAYDILDDKLQTDGGAEVLSVSTIDGLDAGLVEKLIDASYSDLGDICFDDIEHIVEVTGLSEAEVQDVYQKAAARLAEVSGGKVVVA
jgi:N utilization substance protein A